MALACGVFMSVVNVVVMKWCMKGQANVKKSARVFSEHGDECETCIEQTERVRNQPSLLGQVENAFEESAHKTKAIRFSNESEFSNMCTRF
jgi:hypothetical protein